MNALLEAIDQYAKSEYQGQLEAQKRKFEEQLEAQKQKTEEMQAKIMALEKEIQVTRQERRKSKRSKA